MDNTHYPPKHDDSSSVYCHHTRARAYLNQRILQISEGILSLDTLDDVPMIDSEVEAIKATLADNKVPDLSHITPDFLMEVMES